ncbi:MAG: radical SAM protein [Chitinispirillaceae bacterium]|nr:radical SAM protein [Chitinispirillaceae bacterium]
MKILFINPPYTSLAGIAESAGHMMPLCFGYITAYCKDRIEDLEIKILDAEAKGIGFEEIQNTIYQYSPQLVGITVPTPTLNYAYRIAHEAKKINKKVNIVFGGIHPTVMPEKTIEDSRDVDFVVVGEGEETMYRLLIEMRKSRPDYGNVEGILFRSDNEIVKNPRRELIEDLDTIPIPARHLYELEYYRSAPTKKVSNELATPILTSRGCSHDCIHCPSKSIWRQKVRYRSTSNVVDEIQLCVEKYNFKEFNFFDDTFTLNKKRAMRIVEEIINRKLNIYWICFARTNTIDRELVEKMKEAGCRKISFGLESGNQKILDKMRKRTTLEKGRSAVGIVREAGIPVHGSFMLGNVGETEDTIRDTIAYATSLDLDNATFFITTPFPGTDLFKIAMEEGNITKTTPWEAFAPLTDVSPILVQKEIGPDRLVYWQKRAFRQFYLRPKYIKKKMKMLLSVQGVKNLLEGLRVFWRIMRKDRYKKNNE